MGFFSKPKVKPTDKTRIERGAAFRAFDAYYNAMPSGTTNAEICGWWIDPNLMLDYCRKKHWHNYDAVEFFPMALLYLRRRGGKVKRAGKGNGIYVSAWLPHDMGIRSRIFDPESCVPRDPRKVRSLPRDARIDAALKNWGL